MSPVANIAKHVIFSGRVQGVGFRYTAHRIALRYDLTGFVKNLPNGSVEMLIQGHPEDVNDCLRDISESFEGYIRNTHIDEYPHDGRYDRFIIAY